jgi:hypothetical protein
MRKNAEMYFCDNVNGGVEHVACMYVVIVIRPTAVDVSEGFAFLSAGNITGQTDKF